MIPFALLPKLHHGDRVAILSPAFAASGVWPQVHELGLQRLREIFGLEPVEYPTTRQMGASPDDRANDLISAFSDPHIRAVIATIGGDDEVVYAKKLPKEVFATNPKPFFGYSDNTHIINHLWLCGVPSYYGGSLFTQFAMQGAMDDFTVRYLREALFRASYIKVDQACYLLGMGYASLLDGPARTYCGCGGLRSAFNNNRTSICGECENRATPRPATARHGDACAAPYSRVAASHWTCGGSAPPRPNASGP